MKKIVHSEPVYAEKKDVKIITLEKCNSKIDTDSIKLKKLTEEEKVKLSEVIKRVKINATKGYLDTAKTLIIEGLTIDKYNKELNLELASIYEKENNYKHAEYIYKDLIIVFEKDLNIKQKLAFVFAMDAQYKDSLALYDEIYKKRKDDLEVVRMIADLSYDMEDFKKALKFIKVFLKEKPRNVDKMFMQGVCLENTHDIESAIKIYKKILELQPYNTDALSKVKELSGLK